MGPLVDTQGGCRRNLPAPMDALIQGLLLHRFFPALEFNHNRRPLPEDTVPVPAVSGACMLVRRQAHQQIDGFDEGFFLHFEDLDYCARMQQAGWAVMFVPSVRVVHVQGGCSQQNPDRISVYKAAGMRRYFTRHPAGQSWLLPLVLLLLRLRSG